MIEEHVSAGRRLATYRERKRLLEIHGFSGWGDCVCCDDETELNEDGKCWSCNTEDEQDRRDYVRAKDALVKSCGLAFKDVPHQLALAKSAQLRAYRLIAGLKRVRP